MRGEDTANLCLPRPQAGDKQINGFETYRSGDFQAERPTVPGQESVRCNWRLRAGISES